MSKFKAGQMVEILSMEKCLAKDHDYDVGDACKVRGVDEGREYIYDVWNTDESKSWFFKEKQLKAVNKKKYRVYLYYDIRASTVVEADSREDAKNRVFHELDRSGIEYLDLKINEREFDAMNAEEIGEADGRS